MQDQAQKGKKILFVDDDKFLLDMYALKFSKNGYDVKTADNAEAALRLLKSGFVPDIMLVDIVMPGMDGLEFVSVCEKEGLSKHSVVIMLTNQGNPEDIAKAKSSDVDGYIVKAMTIPSEVLAEVEKISASKGQR